MPHRSLGHYYGGRDAAAFTAAVTAAVLMTTTAIYWYYNRRRRDRSTSTRQQDRSISLADKTEEEIEPAPAISSINKSKVDAEIWRSFEVAAHRIRTDKKLKLTSGDQLMFYGLFKHIVSGDAPAKMMSGRQHSLNIVVEQAKHSSWAKMRGIPVPMAITHYVAAVQHFAEQGAASTSTHQQATEDDSVDGASENTSDDMTGGAMGPVPVSRPAMIDNGGMDGDAEDDNDLQVKLLRAAGKNDLTALMDLLKEIHTTSSTTGSGESLNVNYQDELGQTALHLAADKGSVECCIALIEAGANVNAADHDGISVLQAAVIAGHIRICKILLDHGANPDQADLDGDTPRSCAMEDGGVVLQRIFAQSAIPTIQEESDDE